MKTKPIQLQLSFDGFDELTEPQKKRSLRLWCEENNRLDLLSEWDKGRNGLITPDNVTPGSATKVWWLKPFDDPNTGKHFDFSWQAAINHRTHGENCPYLSKPVKKVFAGFNDLATTHPNLERDWDYEKNDELGVKITEVSKGNKTNVYWKCPTHGLYQAVISDRVAGNGCPYCAGKMVKVGMNDLATTHPNLAREFDREKNGFGPENITFGSIKKVWWKCKFGHSWQETPNVRSSQNAGCPFCSGRRVLPGFNDLATINPQLAKEWNYERNGELKPDQVAANSNAVVWWRCEAGHEYKAPICRRNGQGTGCSKCNAERKTSFPEKAILFYVKKQFPEVEENVTQPWLGRRELDIYIPSLGVAIEYDGKSWHKSIERDLGKDQLCEKHGVRLIRVRESDCPNYSSSSIKINCGGYKEYDVLEKAIREVFDTLSIKPAFDINIRHDHAAILEKYLTSIKENSLKAIHPYIAKEWDLTKNKGVTPDKVFAASNRSVWWICPKGHSYQMKVADRTGKKHAGCPICSHKQIVPGINDFASEHPELLPEWDYEKNTEKPDRIPSGSSCKVFWRCPKGHSYEAVVYSRTNKNNPTGCPYCNHQKADENNNVAILYPELMEEWDYELNTVDPRTVLPGSNKKYHWICRKCGYHFEQSMSHRTERHSQCPICTSAILVPGINDLATKFPEVAQDWDEEKNGKKANQVSGGSNKKCWWKCHICGHEWQCVVASRTKKGRKCPKYAHHK